jgi:fucose 4-O-acetylase-like acetyltransferase
MSGMTFKKKNSLKQNIRLKKLLVPYFVYNLFCISVTFIGKFLIDKTIKIKELFTALFGIVYSRFYIFPEGSANNIRLLNFGNSPLWFLTALFISGILFLALYFSTKKQRIVLIVLYIALSVLGGFLPILLPWSFDTSFANAILMFTGYKIRECDIINKITQKRLLSITTVALLTTLTVLLVNVNGALNISIREYGNFVFSPLLYIVIGIIGTLIYLIVFKLSEITLVTRCFSLLGRKSLTIMCSHLLIFNVFSKFLTHIDSKYVVSLFQITAAIVFAVIISFFFKRFKNKISLFQYL